MALFQKAKKRRLFRTIRISFRLHLPDEDRFGILLWELCSGVGPPGSAALFFGEEIKRQLIFIDFDDAMTLWFAEPSSVSPAIKRNSIGEVGEMLPRQTGHFG